MFFPRISLQVEKVPDSTYDMVGGLSKQIMEIKEVGLLISTFHDNIGRKWTFLFCFVFLNPIHIIRLLLKLDHIYKCTLYATVGYRVTHQTSRALRCSRCLPAQGGTLIWATRCYSYNVFILYASTAFL